MAVGEAWTTTLEVLDYIGDEVDLAFQFDLAQAFMNSSRSGAASQVQQVQEQTVESFPPGQYATFLTNHDQDRVMSQLLGDEQKARVVATLLLTSPGVPFIYYGEEIGLQGRKPDENIRRPMQWSGEAPGAGFTTAVPWRSPDDYEERNVALQNGNPASLLYHYQALIRLRNQHEALRIGEWMAVETNSRQVYAYLRASDDETILVLANLGRQPETEYSLDLAEGPLAGAVEVIPLLGEANPAALTANESGGFTGYRPLSELPAYTTFVFQLVSR
jgi:glycosidase